jgi:WD40 repeat protein
MANSSAADLDASLKLSPVQIARLTGLVHQALAVDAAAPPPEAAEFEGMPFGRFESLTTAGLGGFGCVYRAYDPVHSRFVALKIPGRRSVVDPDALQRFRIEMEAGAKIDHPGFVPLFEVGEHEGLPYLVSAFCEGRNLAQWKRQLAAEGRVFDPTFAARIVLAIARATGAAHEMGVIHRDVKPSNVILQPTVSAADVEMDGTHYRVRIVDLGLAKLTESSVELTRTDFRIGTPLYMAPEQVSRSFGPITARTDVYGLGATLYSLAAGREPFTGSNDVDLFAQVVAEAAPPIAKVRPGVPKALAAICHRCLEKAPADRYSSMLDVAKDLERYIEGRRVHASRAWIWKAMRRAARRRTALFAAVFTAFVCLAVTAGMSGLHWVERLQVERRTASSRVEALTSEKAEAEYLAAVPEAFANLDAANYEGVRSFLKRFATAKHAHHIEWRLLKGLADSSLWAVKADSEIRSTAISSLHATVFCGLGDGRLEVRSLSHGSLLETLHRHRGPINAMLPFIDGRHLMTFGADGVACIWSMSPTSFTLKKEVRAHDAGIAAAKVSPDGQHIVTCGGDGVLKIWRTGPLSPSVMYAKRNDWDAAFVFEAKLEGHVGAVHDVSFSLDGRFLVSCDADGRQLFWDFESRRKVGEVPPLNRAEGDEPDPANQVFFLWGGPPYRIATGFQSGRIAVHRFDPPHAPTTVFERSFEVRLRPVKVILDRGRRAVQVIRDDGKSATAPADDLIVAREDGTIAAVPLDSPDGLGRIHGVGHGSQPTALDGDFRFSNHLIATADREGWLRLWDMNRDALGWSAWSRLDSGKASEDGKAAFVGRDFVHVEWPRRRGRVDVFRASDGALVQSDSQPETDAEATDESTACRSHDGRLQAVRSRDSLRLIRQAAGLDEVKLDFSGRTPPLSITDVAFSPGGGFLAAVFDDDDSVVVWSTATGARKTVVYGRSKGLHRCAVSSDGKRILALEKSTGRISIWDARSAATLGSFSAGAPGEGMTLQFDELGKRLLVYIRRHGRSFLEAGGDSVRVFNLAD